MAHRAIRLPATQQFGCNKLWFFDFIAHPRMRFFLFFVCCCDSVYKFDLCIYIYVYLYNLYICIVIVKNESVIYHIARGPTVVRGEKIPRPWRGARRGGRVEKNPPKKYIF